MKRRKGKKRPPTIGRNCKWLVGGVDCRLKIRANDARDDVKYGGVPVYDDVGCAKCRYCGFEEKTQRDVPVEALKSEIGRLEEALAGLRKIVQEEDGK